MLIRNLSSDFMLSQPRTIFRFLLVAILSLTSSLRINLSVIVRLPFSSIFMYFFMVISLLSLLLIFNPFLKIKGDSTGLFSGIMLGDNSSSYIPSSLISSVLISCFSVSSKSGFPFNKFIFSACLFFPAFPNFIFKVPPGKLIRLSHLNHIL